MGVSMLAATLIGTGLGTVVARRMRRSLGTGTPMRLIGNGLVLAAIGAVGLPFVTSDWQLYLLFFIVTVPLVMATILLPTLVQDVSPPGLRSQVTAGGRGVRNAHHRNESRARRHRVRRADGVSKRTHGRCVDRERHRNDDWSGTRPYVREILRSNRRRPAIIKKVR